jgi:hypothetical protein
VPVCLFITFAMSTRTPSFVRTLCYCHFDVIFFLSKPAFKQSIK